MPCTVCFAPGAQLAREALRDEKVGIALALNGSLRRFFPSNLPGKILKTGKSTDPDLSTVPSVAAAYVLDITQPSPAWVPTGSMNFARTYHTTTLLPDGTVLVAGGGPITNAVDITNAILPVEVLVTNDQTWTTLASMSAPRLYHSEALLLPDGRVMFMAEGNSTVWVKPLIS